MGNGLNAGAGFLQATTLRLLDSSKKVDVLVALLIGSLPILTALAVGNYCDLEVKDVRYVGFLSQWNWSMHAILLPIALIVFRWAMTRIAPVHSSDPPKNLPGIVALVSPEGRSQAYQAFRDELLRPSNILVAILFMSVFSVVDVWSALSVYVTETPSGTDQSWATMFVIGEFKINKWGNLAQLFFAYLVQFLDLGLLVYFVVLMARHNLFFLKRVYQRRRVPSDKVVEHIVIDLDDSDSCFGFRKADLAFNTQVVFLWLAGFGLIISRFFQTSNVTKFIADVAKEDPFSLLVLWNLIHKLFPDVGQWVLVICWFSGFAIIALPALVKLLPVFPFSGSGNEQKSCAGFLREFLPDAYWPFGRDPNTQEVDALAKSFAQNQFWPTGNNRGGKLFFLAFLTGLWLLFPVWPDGNMNVVIILLTVVILVLAAATATMTATLLLKQALIFVDQRLVKAAKQPNSIQVDLGNRLGERYGGNIFISYRRKDASAWAGRLHQSLSEHCYPERIFRDLDKIPLGKDFVDAIDEALVKTDIAIVLIGPRWLDIENEDGSRRLDNPKDWVRIEVAHALERDDVIVIPILVDRAGMPNSDSLPEPLRALHRKNAIEIRDERWEDDVKNLVKEMKVASK